MTSATLDSKARRLGYFLSGYRGNWQVKSLSNPAKEGFPCDSLKEVNQLLNQIKRYPDSVYMFDGADWYAI